MHERHSSCSRYRRHFPSRAAAWFAFAVLASLTVDGRSAAAQEWTTAPGTAVAQLPPPGRASGVAGGALHCAEQRWSLVLSLEPDIVVGAGARTATLAVGTLVFEARASASAEGVAIPVAGALIEPLKGGSKLVLDMPDSTPPLAAEFSLRGSRRAIEAAEPECSPRDMSAFERVVLSQESPFVPVARSLREREIAIFREATASEPRIAARAVDLDGGRKLLFAAICGSSWYYGASGCNLTGFAMGSAGGDWRLVYDTEGVEIYLDRGAGADGWPNLVTLPLRGGGDELAWTWSGGQYVLLEPGEPDDLAAVPSGEAAPARP